MKKKSSDQFLLDKIYKLSSKTYKLTEDEFNSLLTAVAQYLGLDLKEVTTKNKVYHALGPYILDIGYKVVDSQALLNYLKRFNNMHVTPEAVAYLESHTTYALWYIRMYYGDIMDETASLLELTNETKVFDTTTTLTQYLKLNSKGTGMRKRTEGIENVVGLSVIREALDGMKNRASSLDNVYALLTLLSERLKQYFCETYYRVYIEHTCWAYKWRHYINVVSVAGRQNFLEVTTQYSNEEGRYVTVLKLMKEEVMRFNSHQLLDRDFMENLITKLDVALKTGRI